MLASDDETEEEQDRSSLLDFGRNAIDQANKGAAQGLDAATEHSRCRDHFSLLNNWHLSLNQISIEDAKESLKAPDSSSPKESLVSDLSKSFLLRAEEVAAQEASYFVLKCIGSSNDSKRRGRKAFQPVEQPSTRNRCARHASPAG